MPINKDTQVNASVVLDKEIYEKLKQLAKDNDRSISGQISYIIKKDLLNYEYSK